MSDAPKHLDDRCEIYQNCTVGFNNFLPDHRPIVPFAYCDTSEKDSGGPGHTIVIGIDDFIAFAHWFAALFGWNPRIAETLGMNAIHFPIMPPMMLLSVQYSTD